MLVALRGSVQTEVKRHQVRPVEVFLRGPINDQRAFAKIDRSMVKHLRLWDIVKGAELWYRDRHDIDGAASEYMSFRVSAGSGD